MKKLVPTVVITLVCLRLAACSPSGPPIQVSAADLIGAYIRNAAAADQEYQGRTLIVSGMSGGVDSEGSGYVLTLVPGIRAHLGSQTNGANLFQPVVVRCRGVSADDGVINLNGCEIVG